MNKARTYTKYGTEAAKLLGKQIRLGRKQRKWSEHELADRAGISRATLQKIEIGNMSVAIGFVFEVAALVGVNLFDPDTTSLARHIARIDDNLALLPKHIHPGKKLVDDDF